MTTQEIMGLRIKELREEMELSQSALAEMVGYKDKTAVAKVEAGKVDLPQSKIVAFSKALNTTPAALFEKTTSAATEQPHIIAAHFDGDKYTEAELEEISQFAEFVKNKRK